MSLRMSEWTLTSELVKEHYGPLHYLFLVGLKQQLQLPLIRLHPLHLLLQGLRDDGTFQHNAVKHCLSGEKASFPTCQ